MNRQILLASRPQGEPTTDNFKLVEKPIAEPGKGEMLLRTLYLSLDPYMRGRMNEQKSYAASVDLGQVMVGATVCRVVKSNIAEYKQGDLVVAYTGWQDYVISDGKEVRKLEAAMQPASALGLMGMPSFTAYVGLLNIGKPKAGETVVVAAASGAVGSVVGQIAKIKGCRVVGIAGGDQKCSYVKSELGFDECIDHKRPDLEERLKAACPKGVDVYFENVGGSVFSAVLPLLNNFARVPVCGLIAHYNDTGLARGVDRLPLLMRNILTKRLTFEGFIVSDHNAQFGDFVKDMTEWLSKGLIKYKEDVTDGLENAPRELIGLLKGENFGKKIIRVSGDSR
ncbi:MAG TPA: NADP-dependent oxidoreductase [Candidatus Obscuribacterales bacterium]